MIFTDFIALLGDFCLYVSTLGYVVSTFGEPIPLLLPACTYLLCVIVFLLMRNVKSVLRFAPILLFIPAFLFAKGIVGIIWLVPLCILLLMRAATGSWSAERDRTLIVFKIALGVYVLIAFLSKASAQFCRSSLPFFLTWLLISVVNLRMLRMPGLNALGTRFKVLNVLLVVSIAAVVFVLSSDACLNAVKVSLGFIYNKLIMPVFLAVLYACFTIPSLVIYFFQWLGSLLKGAAPPPYSPEIAMGQNEEWMDTYDFKEPPQWLGTATAVFGVIILLLICVLIFRRLMAKRTDVKESSGDFQRESVNAPVVTRSKRRFAFTNSPEDVVRSTYRHYLEFCARHDVEVDGATASDVISEESTSFAGQESPGKLRALWLPARYSKQVISSEDAREAKELLRDMRAYASKNKD